MWSYKHHNTVQKIVRPIYKILGTLAGLSWTYAHYINGDFQKHRPKHTHNYFANKTLWHHIKSSWRYGLDEN